VQDLAVANEDYDEAKRLKASIDRLKVRVSTTASSGVTVCVRVKAQGVPCRLAWEQHMSGTANELAFQKV
jgi:hypothetical protein